MAMAGGGGSGARAREVDLAFIAGRNKVNALLARQGEEGRGRGRGMAGVRRKGRRRAGAAVANGIRRRGRQRMGTRDVMHWELGAAHGPRGTMGPRRACTGWAAGADVELWCDVVRARAPARSGAKTNLGSTV
jgi:hypothetical protein